MTPIGPSFLTYFSTFKTVEGDIMIRFKPRMYRLLRRSNLFIELI